MNNEQVREEALQMIGATIPHPDALRWTYVQIMAMIERNGFVIPRNPDDFLSGQVPLKPNRYQ